MAERKFSNIDLDAIHDEIISLKAKGYNQTQIGKALDMSQQNVSHHLRGMQLKKAIKRDANLESFREMLLASANLIKQKAWETAEKHDSPDVIFKALDVIGRADDRIGKACHLNSIPPLLTGEDVLTDATIEEIQSVVPELFVENIPLSSSEDYELPVPSQQKAHEDKSSQGERPVSNAPKTKRSRSSPSKSALKAVQKVTAYKPRPKKAGACSTTA